ncbi:MAG: large conductance mechanosensitive channel protein MscL [Patescibacteria group bacterium]|nr:large conductance mechanosensitive channel protein MscL [Patescibacteria group bacterium]
MFKEFKKFILRGNVVDLAVAVVVGAAFNSVVQSFVKDMITPLVSAVYQQQKFSEAYFSFRGSHFLYGDFINNFISFFIIAAVVFFFVVQPINRLVTIANRKATTPEPSTKKCPDCLSVVPKAASRCAFCTSKLTVAK